MTIHDEVEASRLLMTRRASLEDLREIVSNYPHLRPLVAAYPGTDEALLGWLAGLGDPVVNQALAARRPTDAIPVLTPSSWSASAPATSQQRKPAKLPRVIGLGLVVLAVALAGVFFVPRLLTRAPVLAAGSSHTCVLMSDGTVSCWGDPPTFGHNDENGKTTPRPILELTDAVSVSANSETCAVRADGTVSCWGPRLSDISTGGTHTQLTAIPMQGITGAVKITAGVEHFCMVMDDASVSCWGDNQYGQVGNGTEIRDSAMGSAASAQVVGVADVTAISAGSSHTCAVSKDNTVKCWGYNLHGQLGDGSTTNRTTATPVANLPAVSAIAAGAWHTCALGKDRTVECWGRNDSGQLGNGTTTSSPSPTATQVAGLTDVKAIAAGGSHTCAIRKDRTVVCWGDNQSGQLGDGTLTSSTTPVPVSNLTGVVGIAAGGSHTCAVRKDRTVVCWGSNSAGQLGTGDNTSSPVPVEVTGLR